MAKYAIPDQAEFDAWNRIIAVAPNGDEVGLYDGNLKTIFPFPIETYADTIGSVFSGRPFHPLRLEISPTDFCNQKCSMCVVRYHYSRLRHRKNQLECHTLRRLVADAQEVGIRLITLSGTGELFTVPDIELVLRDFLENRLILMVFTNGSLISEAGAEYLARSNALINVSINGGTREEYKRIHGSDSYDLVCSNVGKIRKMATQHGVNPVIGCSFVVVPGNVLGVRLAAERAKAIGCEFITYKPAVEIDTILDFSDSERILLAEQVEEARMVANGGFRVNVNFNPRDYSLPCRRPAPASRKCFQGMFSVNIASDGGLYPCCVLATLRSSLRVPNVRDMSLKEFVDSDYYRTFWLSDFKGKRSHEGCPNEPFNRLANWLWEVQERNGTVYFRLQNR